MEQEATAASFNPLQLRPRCPAAPGERNQRGAMTASWAGASPRCIMVEEPRALLSSRGGCRCWWGPRAPTLLPNVYWLWEEPTRPISLIVSARCRRWSGQIRVGALEVAGLLSPCRRRVARPGRRARARGSQRSGRIGVGALKIAGLLSPCPRRGTRPRWAS
jgi:hypothetical protein